MYPTDTAVTMWKYSLNANSFVAASEPQPFKKYTSAAKKEKMAWVVEIMLFVVVVVVVVDDAELEMAELEVTQLNPSSG